MRFFALSTFLLALFLTPLQPVRAVEPDEKQAIGKARVALAGRQRMLSQRIAKALCMAQIQPEATRHLREAQKSIEQFQDATDILRSGGGGRGFAAEVVPNVLDALQVMQDTFEGSSFFTVTKTQSADVPVSQLIKDSEAVLDAAKLATKAVAKYHASRAEHSAKVRSVDIAGRQRMLTQKMAKEICFLSSGASQRDVLASLIATHELFKFSMQALIVGDYELRIPPPSSNNVKRALQQFQGQWEPVEDMIARVEADGRASPAQVATIVDALDKALLRMQKIVEMY